MVESRSIIRDLSTRPTETQVNNTSSVPSSPSNSFVVQDLFLDELAAMKGILLQRVQLHGRHDFQRHLPPSLTDLKVEPLINPMRLCSVCMTIDRTPAFNKPQPICIFWSPDIGEESTCLRCHLRDAVNNEVSSPRFTRTEEIFNDTELSKAPLSEEDREACLSHLLQSLLHEWELLVETRSGIKVPWAVHKYCTSSSSSSVVRNLPILRNVADRVSL